MPRYNVMAQFELRTEIEPEGIRFDNFDLPEGTVEDTSIEDESYFSRQDVECDGGSVSVQVEAEDESAAEAALGAVIFDGCEVEDDSGFTWVLDSVVYSVEEIEPEMTLGSAKIIVAAWITGVPKLGMDGDLIPSEVRKALLFLIERG